jgi:hypothetical protein
MRQGSNGVPRSAQVPFERVVQRGFRYFSIDKYQSILLAFPAYRLNPLPAHRLDPFPV